MAANGISTLATKELRQIAKLDLASADRLAVSNPRAYYDITQLPTQYSDNDIIDNPNPDGLIVGRPWIEIPPTPSYAIEFRSITGDPNDLGSIQPADIITTTNEDTVIWFNIIGTNVPDDPSAYLQFGGASITNDDGFWWGEGPTNLIDPIPYNWTGTNTNGTFIYIAADNLTEGNETLTLEWIVNGTTVATASISIVDTSTTPITYSFDNEPTSINEGSSGTFNVVTTGVDDGTTLYWTVKNSTTVSADFSATSGSFTITSNAGSFTVTPTSDTTTEGSETFTVEVRTGSITGTVEVESISVTINDTSTTPTGGLQVYLQTAPSSGTTWTDTAGYSRSATLLKSGTGNYAYNSANGGGIVTTGSTGLNGGMIDIPYNLPSTFTIEIVASISSTNYWSSLFGNEAYTSSKGFLAYFGNDTTLAIGSPAGSFQNYTLSSGSKANRNHYLITVTGSTLNFYLNGTLQTKTSGTFAQPSGGLSTNSLQIGARHPNAGTINTVNDPAHGKYFMVRVYDIVLDQTAVTTNYNEARTAFGL